MKPCTRCRNRGIACEYASSEAGSAAAMHLMHLAANAHHNSPPVAAPSAPMGPVSHNMSSDALPSQTGQPAPVHGLPTHAASAMTNPAYSQSTSSSPPILTSHPQANNEAAQLPTPETLIDQSKLPSLCYLKKKKKFVLFRKHCSIRRHHVVPQRPLRIVNFPPTTPSTSY